MKEWVVDASVAAKWFLPEAHSTQSAKLLSGRAALYAPDLILPEFGSVLWKRVGRRELSHDEATGILADFLRMPLVILSSAPILPAAMELALRTRRTVYDCLYLALALDRGCRLMTGDERFANALAGGVYAGSVKWIGEA
ncbi:MAG: type II toxin-antitoxin system VapC family toxin [Planctomycetota bacterium]